MYTQVAGNQSAPLAEAFVVGSTTVKLDDVDFLSTAGNSNLVTICTESGDKGVTLKYTAKNTNAKTLTVDTTVIESWGTGGGTTGTIYPSTTSIASRPLCKADIAAIQANLTNIDTRMTTAQTNITTLQSSKVDKTTTSDGIQLGTGTTHYAVCSTAGNVAAKTASLPGFVLTTGARAIIRFANGDSSTTSSGASAQPTLNISGTGAAPIKWRGENVTDNIIFGGAVYELIFIDSAYHIVGDVITTDEIAIKQAPIIHGIIIEDDNSDPNDRVKIVGASSGWSRAQREEEYMLHCRHCVFRAGRREYYVSESDWSKRENGTTDSGLTGGDTLSGNFGIEYAPIWWRISQVSANSHLIEFTWENPRDSSWVTPHIYEGRLCSYLYSGAFMGTLSTIGSTTNCLRSTYSTTKIPQWGSDWGPERFYQSAQATGTAEGLNAANNTYGIELPLTKTMKQILAIWVYKTTDFQNNVAHGNSKSSGGAGIPVGAGISLTGGNTQGTVTSVSMENQCVVNGMVDEYGNGLETLDGIIYDNDETLLCAVEGGNHTDISQFSTRDKLPNVPGSWARIRGVCRGNMIMVKKVCYHPIFPFAGIVGGGGASSTTYFADQNYYDSSNTDNPNTMRSVRMGGALYSASNSGMFYVRVKHGVESGGSGMGARLQAHSID